MWGGGGYGGGGGGGDAPCGGDPFWWGPLGMLSLPCPALHPTLAAVVGYVVCWLPDSRQNTILLLEHHHTTITSRYRPNISLLYVLFA